MKAPQENRFLRGRLYQNKIGRWELEGFELTSGSILEVFILGDWVEGRIEHNGNDYLFLTRDEESSLGLQNGLMARVPFLFH